MTLADRILEYDRTVAQGLPGQVPATGGRKLVCVVCPETLTKAPGGGVAARLGLDADTVLLLAVPAARIGRPDAETARGAALLAASAGAHDLIVLGHDGCAFRAPAFPLPGPVP